jgi:hypothetical protein
MDESATFFQHEVPSFEQPTHHQERILATGFVADESLHTRDELLP